MSANTEPRPVVNVSHEVWAAVANFPGYWVSSEGRVRRRGRLMKPRIGHGGYAVVDLVRGGTTSRRSVHRLVAQAFIPNPDRRPLVRHADGDPSDNRASSLVWGTHADNLADARRHGTMPTASHGSHGMYVGHNCRCAVCVVAHLERRRNYRAANRERANAYNRAYRARLKEASA